MDAPAAFRYRPGRLTAAAGAVVAAAAAALMVLVTGTTAAAPSGRCTENVNVRAEPDPGAPVIAICPARTAARLGATRSGYVELTDLDSWATTQCVSTIDTAETGPVPRPPDRNVALTPPPTPESAVRG